MLQGRDSERKAPEPTPPADVTTRIDYNRLNGDFDAFVTVEGLEIYLGSKPSYFDCEALCRDYKYHHYADTYTPEKAATVAMEEYPCECGVSEPTYATERAAAVATRRLVYCERCGAVGTTESDDADWYCSDCAAPAAQCPCGQPATITVRTRSDLHELCSPCFEEQFQRNEARTDAWEVLARVPPIPARFTCEACGVKKTSAGFTQLRAHDTHAVCDDCRRLAAVRHSGAIADQGSDDTSMYIYELALTDPAALRSFLAEHSLYQRERLAWRFASYLKREHNIVREPTLIARNWDNLIGSEEPQVAA
jgi:hypothetical protein